jgi:phage gp46-like protein
MTDIASLITQDPKTGASYIDWLMDGPDLLCDDGLATAVLISLFTDRLADADDTIPGAPPAATKGPADRRGWWGDTPADPTQVPGPSSLTGSRFWLRAGWPATERTARQIELDAREALQWMIDEKIAQNIDVETWWSARDVIALRVAISQRGAHGRPELFEYDYVWSPTIVTAGGAPQMAPAESGILLEAALQGSGQPSYLTSEDDSLLIDE